MTDPIPALFPVPEKSRDLLSKNTCGLRPFNARAVGSIPTPVTSKMTRNTQ